MGAVAMNCEWTDLEANCPGSGKGGMVKKNREDAQCAPARIAAGRVVQCGMTLIELLIVIVIVGILAKIAYSSYAQSVLKSNRSAAKTALLDMAGREERLFTTTGTYTATLANLGYVAGASTPVPSASSHYYDLSVAASTQTTYSLQAVPVGSQANDTQCGTFTLDQLGDQGMTGGTGTAVTCWN
ncbi:MAG: type IV pilin protein [Thiobacillaceae bacterium]